MDIQTASNLVQQVLPANRAHQALEVIGALSLVKQIVPRLAAWGVPAAKKSAAWVARTALNSPLRPVILWQAPNIILFLDSLVSTLTLIMDTFRDELQADLKAAEPKPVPEQTTSSTEAPKI